MYYSSWISVVIINSAITPRLDESSGPNKVFLESIKERAGKKFKVPFLIKNQHRELNLYSTL